MVANRRPSRPPTTTVPGASSSCPSPLLCRPDLSPPPVSNDRTTARPRIRRRDRCVTRVDGGDRSGGTVRRLPQRPYCGVLLGAREQVEHRIVALGIQAPLEAGANHELTAKVPRAGAVGIGQCHRPRRSQHVLRLGFWLRRRRGESQHEWTVRRTHRQEGGQRTGPHRTPGPEHQSAADRVTRGGEEQVGRSTTGDRGAQRYPIDVRRPPRQPYGPRHTHADLVARGTIQPMDTTSAVAGRRDRPGVASPLWMERPVVTQSGERAERRRQHLTARPGQKGREVVGRRHGRELPGGQAPHSRSVEATPPQGLTDGSRPARLAALRRASTGWAGGSVSRITAITQPGQGLVNWCLGSVRIGGLAPR